MHAPGAGKLPAGSAACSLAVYQLWAGVWLLKKSAMKVCGVRNHTKFYFFSAEKQQNNYQ